MQQLLSLNNNSVIYLKHHKCAVFKPANYNSRTWVPRVNQSGVNWFYVQAK